MTPRKILLVSPVFHGYWQAIEAALHARGHEVDTHLYDAPSTVRGKLANKLLHDLPDSVTPARLRGLLTNRTVQAVRDNAPDVVVVVKGDLLQDAFWQLLDELRIPRVTWLYDELRRTRYSPEALRSIGPLATYSAVDARALQATHLPLAFDHRTAFRQRADDVITFIGARYPEREQSLGQLRDAGVPVRVYGRDWSRDVSDRLRTHTLHASDLPFGPTLSRAEAYGVMAGSAATLNLHGDQDGFTMRTFESSGAGGVQIIDRPEVSELYNVGTELLVARDQAELLDLAQRCVREPMWSETIRERGRARTLHEHTFDHRVAVLESLWG